MANIHPTAIVDPKARIGNNVSIGPYSVIGPNVTIGNDTTLKSHIVVEGRTTIGERCEIFPYASIGQKTQDLKYAGGKTYLEIGNDNTIREFVTINTATKDSGKTIIGNNNHIMAYCHIAHECVLGNHIIMSNLATLAGHIIIEDYVVIGGMGGIHQFCRIGKMAMVGACTKINQDVVPYTIVEGNPARTCGLNLVRLKRLGIDSETLSDVKKSYSLVFRKQLKAREAVERIRAEFASCAEALSVADFVESSERGIQR
ncbi:MAG: acyl-[acyl-carrier-protein]--UDP-N-acetylglucosamine O-acyltransferase [Chlamydiae bacterium]|nr:MAG: acyl-[acyl-carrier-protein]--UDP-N-acetylglucosamine O-acyltransferase [Chlamydiota bacterium]